jgi:hypothetical protein
MWRVSKRQLPLGIQLSGGSDWFALTREFVDYVINSNDNYLINLKEFYKYTLLPSEVRSCPVLYSAKIRGKSNVHYFAFLFVVVIVLFNQVVLSHGYGEFATLQQLRQFEFKIYQLEKRARLQMSIQAHS